MRKGSDPPSPATLGDVLNPCTRTQGSEQVLVNLVHSVAGGDQHALHALYGIANRIVFTLMMRLTANRETAEELTIDVFHDVWRDACRYDAAKGTVLAWIVNHARSRAIDRLRFESRKRRKNGADHPPEPEAAADPHDLLELRQQEQSLRAALATLTPGEREAVEMTFFAGHTHAEAAVRLNQPLGTINTRIRSGLHKLRNAMAAEGESQ
jgi:RNA polymerase sigma-70 factor (ECF subfamily)